MTKNDIILLTTLFQTYSLAVQYMNSNWFTETWKCCWTTAFRRNFINNDKWHVNTNNWVERSIEHLSVILNTLTGRKTFVWDR